MNHHNTTPVPLITAVHPHIIESHILNRLDGHTLASASCVSSELNTLCSRENLWQNICNISWPSTLDPLLHNQISSHRTFFSYASSVVHSLNHPSQPNSSKIKKLISAVDIHYQDNAVCSRVVITESSSSWFACSPCIIDLLEHKEVALPTSAKLASDEGDCMKHLEKFLKLSWILIDPDTNMALNISSKNPVLVKRHWLTKEFQVRYATVIPDCRQFGKAKGEGLVQCGVVISCRLNEEGEMQLTDVIMIMEDLEGLLLDGTQALQVLQEVMMNGERKKLDLVDERERHDMFVKLKTDLSDVKQRREHRLDMMCVFTGVSIFLAFWTFVLFT